MMRIPVDSDSDLDGFELAEDFIGMRAVCFP